MKKGFFIFLSLWWACSAFVPGKPTGNYKCQNGTAQFKSEAPLETIQAKSTELKGIIDPEKMAFAWVVKINSFEGFNNPLQKVHFRENYMESDRFPTATFKGKIIEEIDLTKVQKTTLRAKGKLNIHGIEKERIIKIEIDIQEKAILIKANFSIPLDDHDINIPKIVNQKIAETVEVSLSAKLVKE